MRRVFIIHDQHRLNFQPARKHGELKILIHGHVAPENMGQAVDLMRSQLIAHKIVATDWLLPVGAPTLIMAAAAVQYERAGVINVLSWDGQLRDYVPMEIRL